MKAKKKKKPQQPTLRRLDCQTVAELPDEEPKGVTVFFQGLPVIWQKNEFGPIAKSQKRISQNMRKLIASTGNRCPIEMNQ